MRVWVRGRGWLFAADDSSPKADPPPPPPPPAPLRHAGQHGVRHGGLQGPEGGAPRGGGLHQKRAPHLPHQDAHDPARAGAPAGRQTAAALAGQGGDLAHCGAAARGSQKEAPHAGMPRSNPARQKKKTNTPFTRSSLPCAPPRCHPLQAKDPALAEESWDRFLPQFKKKNVQRKKPKKARPAAPALGGGGRHPGWRQAPSRRRSTLSSNASHPSIDAALNRRPAPLPPTSTPTPHRRCAPPRTTRPSRRRSSPPRWTCSSSRESTFSARSKRRRARRRRRRRARRRAWRSASASARPPSRRQQRAGRAAAAAAAGREEAARALRPVAAARARPAWLRD